MLWLAAAPTPAIFSTKLMPLVTLNCSWGVASVYGMATDTAAAATREEASSRTSPRSAVTEALSSIFTSVSL